jgi:hypothetical protein
MFGRWAYSTGRARAPVSFLARGMRLMTRAMLRAPRRDRLRGRRRLGRVDL